jgi:two-component system, OmpR family, sensor kinase
MTTPTYSLVTRLGHTLTLWVGSFWLLTTMGISAYVYHEIQESFDASLQESAHRLLDLAVHEVDETDAPAPSRVSGSKEVEDSQGAKIENAYLSYQVFSAPGNMVLRSAGAPTRSFVVHLAAGFNEGNEWRTYTLRHSARELYIVVADSTAHRMAALRETIVWLIVPLLALLPLLIWAVRKVTAVELRSVQRMAIEITARGGDNLSPISVPHLSTELGAIADSANYLLARLEDALKIERALAANAAHELRTPLAAARLSLNIAQSYPMSADAIEATKHVALSLEALGMRTEKILQLSRAEAGAALNQETVELGQLAMAVVSEFGQVSSSGARVKLHLPAGAAVTAQGDMDSLAIALRNLIENSLKYAPDSDVYVTIASPASITVRDAGPGVAAGDLERLQKRHVRLASNQAGYGLGMSIVRTIVEKQGGVLRLYSPPKGYVQGFEAVLILKSKVIA